MILKIPNDNKDTRQYQMILKIPNGTKIPDDTE